MYWGGRSKGVAVATGTIQNVMRRSRAHSALRVEHWRNGHGRPWRKQRQGQKRKTKKGSAESEREEEGEGREKEEQIGARWVGFPCSQPWEIRGPGLRDWLQFERKYPVLCQKSADPKRERFRRSRGGHGRGLWPTSGIRTGVRCGR